MTDAVLKIRRSDGNSAHKLAIEEVLKRKEITIARNKKKYRAEIQDC
jgi:hypothetical protein